jgi:hypothetical protein
LKRAKGTEVGYAAVGKVARTGDVCRDGKGHSFEGLQHLTDLKPGTLGNQYTMYTRNNTKMHEILGFGTERIHLSLATDNLQR